MREASASYLAWRACRPKCGRIVHEKGRCLDSGLRESRWTKRGLVAAPGCSLRGACEVRLADFLRAVAQLLCLADERLLPRWIPLEIRLDAQEQVLVDECFYVAVVQLERLVDRRQPGLSVLDLLGVAQAEVAIRLF